MPIVRRWFVTDKNGNEIEIKSQSDLQRILDQMTPEEKKRFQDQYRFAPIHNATGNPDYTGTGRDV